MKPPVYTEAWGEEVVSVFRHDMQELWDPTIAPHVWNMYQEQLRQYMGFADSCAMRILDVGCAQATLAMKLAEAGHYVTAVDVRQSFLDYARSRYTHGSIDFVCANVLEDPLEGEFDLIFANQILEHVVRPDEILEALRERLRPGGLLVASTPNHDYVMNDLPSFEQLGDPMQYAHLENSADGDGHFFFYTASELVSCFARAGFSEIAVKPFESPFVSGHMKLRFLHGRVPIALLRAADVVARRLPIYGANLCHQLLATARRAG